MNLPFLKRFNKKITPLYYLVLVLRDEKAEAVIFEEIESKVKVIGLKEEHFSTSIDAVSQEELLEKLDKAISTAESSLPENIQTQKTIFGVKESWTDNDQIKKEHLSKLKKTSEELGLVPIGFLVISQAISHLLQKEEGVPVSAILVEVNKKSVTVTLLRAGKSIETKSSEVHESVPFTVDTLLKHFSVAEILPSRIIIFNGKEDLSQEFISHTWSKSLPFLHLPQITNLPEGFDAKAVLFGAATQMGFAITESPVITKNTEISTEITEKKPNVGKQASLDVSVDSSAASVFPGFVKDIDVAKMPAPPQEEEIQEAIEEIKKEPAHNASHGGTSGKVIPQFKTEETFEKIKSSKKLYNIFPVLKDVLIAAMGFILSIAGKITIKKNSQNTASGKLKIVIAGIIIFVFAIIASYFMFLKATIALTVNPKIKEQSKNVLFSTTEATNPENNIIKGEFITVSEEGSTSTAATGKKDIGTSAKGSVTIFNSSNESITIPAGTTITSSNDLEFKLDNSINLASASSSVDPVTLIKTIKPSTVNANITANQLGKESNLPSGNKFTVSNFDNTDVLAKNDNPFSGGTTKVVTVASKNDSTKLEADIIKQLENQAKEDLQKQLGTNKVLLPKLISETLGKKSLNVKIGDETNQVTLTGTVEYQGIAYDKDDLVSFSKSLLSKDVSSNQEIDYNNLKTSVLDVKNKNNEEIEASLNIKALLLPKIDEKKLVRNIKGKSFKITQELFYKLPQVANVSIKLSPNLPFLPKKLPTREGNIKILLRINE